MPLGRAAGGGGRGGWADQFDRPVDPQGTAHHPRRPRAQRQGGPGAPKLIREMWFFIYTEGTMKGQNKCQWLVIGFAELCRKSCLGDYCKNNLARLRQDPGTQPCMVCGPAGRVGVPLKSGHGGSQLLLCNISGYQSLRWICFLKVLVKLVFTWSKLIFLVK